MGIYSLADRLFAGDSAVHEPSGFGYWLDHYANRCNNYPLGASEKSESGFAELLSSFGNILDFAGGYSRLLFIGQSI